MFKYIIDGKIELRLLEMHHSRAVFNLIDSNRKHLREYLPWVDSTVTIADSQAFIDGSKKKYALNRGFDAGIWYNDEFVGTIGFHSMDLSINAVSLGYWLGEEFVGKGIVIKASRVLIEYAFETLGFNRIEIKCEENNRKSKALPERLGFTKEGIMRSGEKLYGKYSNLLVYSLLKDEWVEKKKSERICPICGEDNNCQSGSDECWCRETVIADYIIDMVPEDKKGEACICKNCVEKYTQQVE